MAAYHPLMMVRVLLYGYCLGIVSSRKLERATYQDVAFRYLAADQHPDHDSIASFRQTHLQALAGLFMQALQLCEKAGLVKLGHVAIDGTKLKANASKHKAMSYERMTEKEKQLREEVDKLLAQAAQVDAEEDGKYGKGKQADELPAELARRESRLQKIAEAKASLEQEARERAVIEKARVEQRLEERRQQVERTGKKIGGNEPKVPDPDQAKPEPKAQRNFTDPESRIMLDGATKSYTQAYNAQLANALSSSCASGQSCADHCRRDTDAGYQRSATVSASAKSGGTEYGPEARTGNSGYRLFQRSCGNGPNGDGDRTIGAAEKAEGNRREPNQAGRRGKRNRTSHPIAGGTR